MALGFPDMCFPQPDIFTPVLSHQETSCADVVLGVFPAVSRQVLRGDVAESDVLATRNVHLPSLDDGTIKALNELQEERGLYMCGCVSYETIVALGLKPDVLVTTVAVGATSGSAYGTDDRYRSGFRSGIYYPIAVPIFVPVNPDDPDSPEGPDGGSPASGIAPAPTFPPPGAVPPGVRPLPPPARVIPSGSN